MTLHAHDRTLQAPPTTIFPASGHKSLYPPRRLDAVHPSPILTEPPTPTSTIRTRNASPTTMDDDAALAPTLHRTTRKRSSSRTYRWIEDQHQHAIGDEGKLPAECHPYLAYPQMSVFSLVTSEKEGPGAVDSYVFPDEDVVQPTGRAPRVKDAHVTQVQTLAAVRPETPPKTLTHRKSRNLQSLFRAPSPLRSLHRTFSSYRQTAPASGAPRAHSPVSSTSASTFRKPEQAPSHSRGSSLSTTNSIRHITRPNYFEVQETPPKSTPWKFRRPSIAGHFTPQGDEDSEGSPSRPSISSSVTQSGSSTTYARTSSDAPCKMYFGSIRSHSSTTIFSSSPSLWSLPADASHINDPPESTKVIARDRVMSGSSEGIPMTWKPATPTNFSNMSNLLTGPKSRRKRKLIISGIPPDDERRFDAARKWCQSFGELTSIIRVPNGDLHVDFRKVEVADTVCRLNARVFIAGVGSVCLSWFTGKRP